MIVVLSMWQVGLVLLCRGWIVAALGLRAVETIVMKLNAVMMSVYLWHMTALLLALLMLKPLGLANSDLLVSQWWSQRPMWLIVAAAILVVVIRLVGWVEREGAPDVRVTPKAYPLTDA